MLDRIIASTRDRVSQLPSMKELRQRASDGPPPRPFAEALTGDRLAVIAEVKRRSPSRGDLAPDLDPARQGKLYVEGGAAAISVLTEPRFFSGSAADLIATRATCEVPVLRKDFTIDRAQVWEARAMGADAILLIVAVLGDDLLRRLLSEAGEACMGALVEVHTAAEAERALAAGASILGVNNRNLQTFEVDMAIAESLAPIVTQAPVSVAESGIHTGSDALRMAEAGYDAILVGESLVRSNDPRGLIRQLRVRFDSRISPNSGRSGCQNGSEMTDEAMT